MKSIKQVTMTYEVISMLVLISVLTIGTLFLRNRLQDQLVQFLESTNATIDDTIGLYLKERADEFERMASSENPKEVSQYFDQFSDVYLLDNDLKIKEIFKLDQESKVFEGYQIISGDLAQFLKNHRVTGVQSSSVLRSVENDSVSIYQCVQYKDDMLVGRIGFEEIHLYLKKLADSYQGIIILANERGYIISSSQSNLPFKLVPDVETVQVTLQEPYMLTKYKSKKLENQIVLLTPTSRLNGPIEVLTLLIPFFVVILIISFFVKYYVLKKSFITPIQAFIKDLKTYTPDGNQSEKFMTILQTKEIQDLHKTFAEKADEIENSFNEMSGTRESALSQLLESEKLASLGGLVAGIAHEVNTPIGVCVTTTSYIETLHEATLQAFESETLKKASLASYFKEVKEGLRIIEISLERASALIQNFKKIAVEQSSELEMAFDLEEQYRVVMGTLRHELKNKHIEFLVDCPRPIEYFGSPGAFHQIFTNLIMNSVIHGIKESENGIIWLSINQLKEGAVEMIYKDNGVGIPVDFEKKVFEPFFTTNRKNGGSGLGLHIIFNLVTQKLNGTIQVCQVEGYGAVFKIIFPMRR